MLIMGLVLWIILWQLEQIIAKSFSSTFTGASTIERGTLW